MLPIPILDDERFGEIAEQARSMIPRLCPEWTDFNYHDPGITFLELFAFLKESQQYHLDQIGPASRSKYLKLMGVARQGRSPAHTRAAVLSDRREGRLPRGTRLMAGEIPFELTRPVELSGGRLMDGFACDGDRRWAFQADHNGGKLHLEAFGHTPQVGNACYFRFDGPWAAETPLSIHLWISQNWPVARNPARPEDFTPLADLCWEVLTAKGWTPIRVLRDDTCGMLFSGDVLLDTTPAPCSWADAPASERELLPAEGCWLRVRLTGGSFDVPPVLTGVTDCLVPVIQRDTPAACMPLQAREGQFSCDSLLAAWGEFEVYRQDENGFCHPLGQVSREVTDSNVVFHLTEPYTGPVLLLLWRSEFDSIRLLGPGDGFPNQCFQLEQKGLLTDSVIVLAEELDGSWRIWQRRDDFDASGPEDRHFTLDEASGELRFGSCIHGLAPEGKILLAALSTSFGPGGDVKAGRISAVHPADLARCQLTASDLQITNPDDAAGGRERESDELCLARCRKLLRSCDRAVTYEDFERLVRQVPGLMISNCKAIPVTQLPRQDGSLEENCVTVVVEPYSQEQERTLSPAYRDNILNYLDSRRLLGTRVSIQPPTYIKLTIYAEIVAQPHYVDAKERIRDGVTAYFRKGWEFGRPVRYSELYGTIDTLDCVQRIDALTIDAQGKGISRGLNGDVILPYNGLAVLKQTELQVRTEE